MPVALRSDFDASAVRAAAKRSKDGPQTRRLLTVAAIYDGATRTQAIQAAAMACVTLQIVCNWFRARWSGRSQGAGTTLSAQRFASRGDRGDQSRAGRSQPFMASCAGASSIFANGCSTSMASRSHELT